MHAAATHKTAGLGLLASSHHPTPPHQSQRLIHLPCAPPRSPCPGGAPLPGLPALLLKVKFGDTSPTDYNHLPFQGTMRSPRVLSAPSLVTALCCRVTLRSGWEQERGTHG